MRRSASRDLRRRGHSPQGKAAAAKTDAAKTDAPPADSHGGSVGGPPASVTVEGTPPPAWYARQEARLATLEQTMARLLSATEQLLEAHGLQPGTAPESRRRIDL